MIIVFFSNFLNHHQLPICLNFYNMENIEFYFVASEKIPNERLQVGYVDMNSKYEFVIKAYEVEDKIIENIIDKADFIIFGSSKFKYLKQMLSKNKIVFRYNERPFKNFFLYKFHPNYILDIYSHFLCNKKNVYLLSAGAFVASDFIKLGLYKEKAYKWGYFPRLSENKYVYLCNKKKKIQLFGLDDYWIGNIQKKQYSWQKSYKKMILILL